jgi:hypothetical protein
MANLSPIITFSEPVTRQDLYNAWSTAALGLIVKDDLAPGTLSVESGNGLTEAPSSPHPGQMYWSQVDQLLFAFHDEVDNTGVSLWLAVGPDRFDTPGLLTGPAAGGALLQLTGDGKKVSVVQPNDAPVSAIGCNQANILHTLGAPSTAASGTWVPVAIDGIMYGLLTDSTASVSAYHYASSGGESAIVSYTHPGAIGFNNGGVNSHNPPERPTIGAMCYRTTPLTTLRFIFTGYREAEVFYP